jgi:hypothetical protein
MVSDGNFGCTSLPPVHVEFSAHLTYIDCITLIIHYEVYKL